MYVCTLCIFHTLIFSKIYFLQFFGRWKLLYARRSVRAVFAKQRSNLRPQRMQHQHMHKHKHTQTCADVCTSHVYICVCTQLYVWKAKNINLRASQLSGGSSLLLLLLLPLCKYGYIKIRTILKWLLAGNGYSFHAPQEHPPLPSGTFQPARQAYF